MIILTIRTDKPEAEIGLYQDNTELTYVTWMAHRQLAETMHQKIKDVLASQMMTLQDISAIGCFQGPGSFTGLRIGLTVANSLAYGLQIPIVGQMDTESVDWKSAALSRLLAGQTDVIALPEYGADVHITPAKQQPSQSAAA